MAEIKTEPVTAALVDDIVAEDAPAGAIKFYPNILLAVPKRMDYKSGIRS